MPADSKRIVASLIWHRSPACYHLLLSYNIEMKPSISIFIFTFFYFGCKTNQSKLVGKKYQHIDATYSGVYKFDNDTSLTFTFTPYDSAQLITTCDYKVNKDSIFVTSSQQQFHVQYLSIVDTLLVTDSNTLLQLPDKTIFKLLPL